MRARELLLDTLSTCGVGLLLDTMSSLTLPRSFTSLGVTVSIRATAEETGGAYSLIETHAPPGFPGAPMHYHAHMTESFYVLEGELAVTVDGASRTVRPGEVAFVAAGARHAFRNASEGYVRFLTIATPGGHDKFFFELAEWMEREPEWPPKDRAKLVEFGLRHDTFYV